jgi:hypothetical protein
MNHDTALSKAKEIADRVLAPAAKAVLDTPLF